MKKVLRDVLIAVALAGGAPLLAFAAAGAGPSADAVPTSVAYDLCSWNRPGVNPFMGDVVAAVDRYRDIPVDVRARLKARMARREYDDLVSIRRDSIHGRGGYDYGSTISEMHFGTHQLCHAVTRTEWSPTMEERGLVYCESGHCILVPTVCRNVSRVARKGVGNELAEAPPAQEPSPALAMADLPAIDWFGPTGAGTPAGAAPSFGGVGLAMPESVGAGRFAESVVGFAGPTGSTPLPGLAPVVPVAVPVAAVPEPQTWGLMLGGLAALLAVRRRAFTRPAAASGSAP